MREQLSGRCLLAKVSPSHRQMCMHKKKWNAKKRTYTKTLSLEFEPSPQRIKNNFLWFSSYICCCGLIWRKSSDFLQFDVYNFLKCSFLERNKKKLDKERKGYLSVIGVSVYLTLKLEFPREPSSQEKEHWVPLHKL